MGQNWVYSNQKRKVCWFNCRENAMQMAFLIQNQKRNKILQTNGPGMWLPITLWYNSSISHSSEPTCSKNFTVLNAKDQLRKSVHSSKIEKLVGNSRNAARNSRNVTLFTQNQGGVEVDFWDERMKGLIQNAKCHQCPRSPTKPTAEFNAYNQCVVDVRPTLFVCCPSTSVCKVRKLNQMQKTQSNPRAS